jgi:hypothetical protein
MLEPEDQTFEVAVVIRQAAQNPDEAVAFVEAWIDDHTDIGHAASVMPHGSVLTETDRIAFWRALSALPYAGGLLPRSWETMTMADLLSTIDQLTGRLSSVAKEYERMEASRNKYRNVISCGREVLEALTANDY